jgi:transglutaminase-like putative cysteine protease
MKLTVRHTTTYRYKKPVAFGEHRVMFRPHDSYDQRLLEASLVITPEPADLRWIHDVFGNSVAIARFDRQSDELRFDITIRLDHTPTNILDFTMADYAEAIPFSYGAEEMPDLMRTMERQYFDPDHVVDRWARQFLSPGQSSSTRDTLMAMTRSINAEFSYVRRNEMGTQDPATTLALRSGSCRDFALLMMEGVRSFGLAARFVSGYLYVPDTGRGIGGGATHAWVQVYLPGAGWVEFDPTNGIVGNLDLIRVAVARDPRQAVPLSGTWIGLPDDSLDMSVEVSVVADGEARALHERVG